jgi:hypothetical protein
MATLPDKNAQPAQLLADIDAYIDAANAMLAQGETVMLAGLDDAVDALCKRVLELRTDEAQPFVEKFEAMRIKLDALQNAMVNEKNRVAAEISETTKRQKASRAYRTPEDKS